MARVRAFRARQHRFGLALSLPALLVFAVVIFYPFLASFRLAFFSVELLDPEPVFVGLANFVKLAGDATFWRTWWTTIVYVALTTGATVLLGFGWAMILAQSFRGRAIIRTLGLLPWVLPTTVTAFLWAWILNGQYGLLNAALLGAGAIRAPVVWLADPVGAMIAIIMAKTWLSTPVAMAFFLAALQSVSSEEVDAARLDGCSEIGVIGHVVLPHILPTLIVVVVLQAMANLQQIDTILALTRGGPARATTVLSIEVYQQAFGNWSTGMAAAIGVVWFATIAVPAVIYLQRIFRET